MLLKEEYAQARKLGMKEFRARMNKREYPYLQVLDQILNYVDVAQERKLGLVDIPLDQIIGTKTEGRTNAFAHNFMPLMQEDSEFAIKWMNLYEAHMEEGIRDPIVAYEFMNYFYIMEGNKRVSVMKYVGASSIPGYVTRVVPKKNDSKDIKLYYEFMEFYEQTELNFLIFTQLGSYKRLLHYVSPGKEDAWTQEMQLDFKTAYYRFEEIFKEQAGNKKMPLTPADAFLIYLDYYSYTKFLEKTQKELKEEVSKLWDDFLIYPEKRQVRLKMDDGEMEASRVLDLGIRNPFTKLKVAFLHDKTPETSRWTYMHDLGRQQIEEEFGNKIVVYSYYEVSNTSMGIEKMKDAIEKGCTVIFTTTPNLIKACTSIAVKYPNIKILNCSLSTYYGHIRTYYGRLYEAKFLLGVIAGIMADTPDIAYLADYPIAGAIANINAFALGVKMVNPRAKIHLHWYKKKNEDLDKELWEEKISVVSGYDNVTPNKEERFGIYKLTADEAKPLAMPVLEWGIFYSKVIQSVLHNTWKKTSSNAKETTNYWWGMSTGMIDVLLSGQIPNRVKFLIEVLQKDIKQGNLKPFDGDIYDQEGNIKNKEGFSITPYDVMEMDWLVDNIIGSIPSREELVEDAQMVVEIQGAKKEDRSDL